MSVVNYNHISKRLLAVEFVMPPVKEKVLRAFCKKACQILSEVVKKPEDIQAAFFAATHNTEDAEWGKSIGLLALLPDRFVYITVTEKADKMITYGFPHELSKDYSLVENIARTGMAALNFKHEQQNFSFVAYNGLIPTYFMFQLGKIDMHYSPKKYSLLRKFLKRL